MVMAFRRATAQPVRVVPWRPHDMVQRVEEAIAIYAAAMHYPLRTARARAGYLVAHTSRPGFRAVGAFEGERLVGFGYGYTSTRGQWWHEQVRGAMAADRTHWLTDCFELSELHVAPPRQGRGIGRSLLETLLAELPERRVLLSTPEGDSPAWQLYRSLGFVDLLRQHHFVGDARPFGVLGLDRRADQPV